MTYRTARDRLYAAAGWPLSDEFHEALSEFEQCVRLEERRTTEIRWTLLVSEIEQRRANG